MSTSERIDRFDRRHAVSDARTPIVSFVWLWLPVLVYMAGIFSASAMSNPPMPSDVPDVSLHGLAYFGLSALLIRAFAHGRWSGVTRRALVLGFVVAVIYGLTDETHQIFVPAAELMIEARKMAHALASKAPLATRYILEAVNRGLEMPLAEGQYLEGSLFGLVASTDDMKEGTKAFLEKRQASWRGQ